jgi:hypothetical protein
MAKPKKIVTHELIEIRTVLSRALTALDKINGWESLSSFDRFAYDHQIEHTPHELSMMRSALIRTIEDLTEIEAKYGWERGEDPDSDGGSRHGGNGPDPEAPSTPGVQIHVSGGHPGTLDVPALIRAMRAGTVSQS